MNNEEVYQSAADNCRTIVGLLDNVRLAAKELSERADNSAFEALGAGGVNDSWAAEVDRLHRLLDRSSNYVADKEIYPTVVQFDNGRVVRVVSEGNRVFLDVSFVPPNEIPQPPLTDVEHEALENFKNSDFVQRLIKGEFDEKD